MIKKNCSRITDYGTFNFLRVKKIYTDLENKYTDLKKGKQKFMTKTRNL
jgi:hypothetical protein